MMEQYPMVMQAFNLINETFSRCLPRWRLFQLVFIVSQIPDIAVRQFPKISATTRISIDLQLSSFEKTIFIVIFGSTHTELVTG